MTRLFTSALVLCAALTTLSSSANAQSAPQLHIEADYGASVTVDASKVWLEKVTFWGCGGALVVTTVEETIDLDAGYSVDLPSTSFCQVKLSFGTDILVEGTDNNSTFTALSPTRAMEMSIATGQTLDLDLLGTHSLEGIYGGNPQLSVTRD